MKFNLGSGRNNQIVNGIFSGYYNFSITGTRKRLFELSSPSRTISQFTLPYDAKLISSTGDVPTLVAVGKAIKGDCSPQGERTGVLYYSDNFNLIGACHGYGHTTNTHYSGHNFYQAFYPIGYFSPPYGENISIFKTNEDGLASLDGIGCNTLSVTEYNEMYGINSISASDVGLTTNTLTPSTLSIIKSPQEACPPNVTVTNYFDEINYNLIGGTTLALGAGDPYNGNPIPTSLDAQDIKVEGRYELLGDSNGSRTGIISNGRIQPSYSNDDIQNKLNNILCPASLMETKVSTLKSSNGLQLMNAPDMLRDDLGGQVSFAGQEGAHYWHFLFKENTHGFPFTNNFIPAEKNGRRHPGLGTQLFAPVLSHEEMYWENRQCPATVDFLPYTVGGAIYSCPSEHFDIPYYAAIKKFGFYGTRFFNTCKSLNLDYELSGIENASEISLASPFVISKGENEPEDLDKNGSGSFNAYVNILRTAKAEERYSNVYALNKGFFLWANRSGIIAEPEYTALLQNSGFRHILSELFRTYDSIFTSGLSSFTGDEPNIIISTGFQIIDSGVYNDSLLTNNTYLNFKNKLREVFSGTVDFNRWTIIENKWSYYIAKPDSSVNESFYKQIISGREKRIRTRYFENQLRGNPIDLFPLNSITFSTDKANDYLNNTEWSRRSSSFGLNSNLPQVNRRYFEGAYGKASAITGLIEKLNSLSTSELNYFYPGFFNDINCGKERNTPSYVAVKSGKIIDSQSRPFSPSGWLAIGYNEVGSLDSNFSCFTPIFVQQPLQKVICKVGQAPTLRALAVDYHTIPEDKINKKYPEILFWAYKLKMFDCKGRYLYPMKHKWFRVPKTGYNAFIASGDFTNFADWSNPTGQWAALEGNSSNCTIIHPTECSPTGVLGNVDSYTFVKGAKYGIDDQYYYFCLASGRFGVRISNPTELVIENWISFDVSFKNGMNAGGSLSVEFDCNSFNGDSSVITIEGSSSATNGASSNYGGYKYDPYAIPETMVDQKVPPPNAGWGDVAAVRFVGPVGYIGELRSFAPSYLRDTRGLRERWGHMLDYGSLIKFSKQLNQTEGDLIYGYKHLPTCENYAMPNGKKGVKTYFKVNGSRVAHWSLEQKAIASLDSKFGMKYDKLTNIGDLYPPIWSRKESPNFGVGHWQFANNLGSIKRFGYSSSMRLDGDIEIHGGWGSEIDDFDNRQKVIKHLKEKLLKPTDLAGENCGYTKYGAGRNMLYHIEAYERFYILCDPIKKKNVTNRSFVSPGLRHGNSSIQYFWLGKPNNTYLTRRSMYGPYAYQWKVNRHNRDRHGNGISEGFYSMGWDNKYSLMYDAPANFGLYVRNENVNNSFKGQVERINVLRRQLFDGGIYIRDMKNYWFGEARGEGTSRRYGDTMYSCKEGDAFYNAELCEYVSLSQTLANSPNFRDYSCPESKLKDGECFDPCLSMRHAQGFFPGGKLLDLFGYQSSNNENTNRHNVRIVPNAILKNGGVLNADEKSKEDPNMFFRSPIMTPYGVKTQRTYNNMGISPCQDGGADHCNYITPLISLGSNNHLLGLTTEFNYISDVAANAG